MNKRRSHNWLAKSAYILICLVFLWALYVVIEAFLPEGFDLSPKLMTTYRGFTSERDIRELALSGAIKEKVLFLLNQEKKFEKSKIIYRGLEGGSAFKIDVVIPELDPNAYYRYRIHIEDAKKGFRLGGQNFKLISARKSAAQLWHFKL